MNQDTIQIIEKATHVITVTSTYKQIENKSFSIKTNLNTNKIIQELERHINQNKETLFYEPITYDNTPKKATHRIIIIPKDKQEKSKSFSINTPSYSSEEINQVLKNYIQTRKYRRIPE